LAISKLKTQILELRESQKEIYLKLAAINNHLKSLDKLASGDGFHEERVKNLFNLFNSKKINLEELSQEYQSISSKVFIKLKKYSERIVELKEYIDQKIKHTEVLIEEVKGKFLLVPFQVQIDQLQKESSIFENLLNKTFQKTRNDEFVQRKLCETQSHGSKSSNMNSRLNKSFTIIENYSLKSGNNFRPKAFTNIMKKNYKFIKPDILQSSFSKAGQSSISELVENQNEAINLVIYH